MKDTEELAEDYLEILKTVEGDRIKVAVLVTLIEEVVRNTRDEAGSKISELAHQIRNNL